MATNYAYCYAYIDPTTKMCIQFYTTDTDGDAASDPNVVAVPVNDPEYIGKYYINGAWYEDAEGTIPWTSSLL